MIRIYINDQPYEIEAGTTVLQAAREHDIHIPTLCFHPALKPAGSCRLCAVEMTSTTGHTAIMLACILKGKEGLRIQTHSEKVIQARTKAFKHLLGMAPLSHRIREMAIRENIVLPPLPDGCIRCRLCIRVCKEIVGREALRMETVNHNHYVVPVPNRCIGCGTCANLCPTQAIRLTDEGGVRTIKIREDIIAHHPLERCEGCGRYYATPKQVELVEQRTAPHPHLKEHHKYCPACAKLFSDRLQILKKQPPKQQFSKRQRP
jgi:bidirectional [NiFe] hydrogenase diaphorase subunit